MINVFNNMCPKNVVGLLIILNVVMFITPDILRGDTTFKVSDNLSLGDRYLSNSLDVKLYLGPIFSVKAGYSMYQTEGSTASKSYNASVEANIIKNLFASVYVTLSPELNSYKNNSVEGYVSYSMPLDKKEDFVTELNLTYNKTVHSQKIYRPLLRVNVWNDLSQTSTTGGFSQTLFGTVSVYGSYSKYSYDKDLTQVQTVAYRLRSSSTLGLLSGFPGTAWSVGASNYFFDWLSASGSVSKTVYALDDTWQNSYYAAINIYPPIGTSEVSLNYNQTEDSDKYTSKYYGVGLAYSF